MLSVQLPQHDGSRRDTTLEKAHYLAGSQLTMEARPGSRAWVRHGLRLRVAEQRSDRALCATIVRRRHYLARWPVPVKTLFISYLGDLAGAGPGTAGAAAFVMIACLAAQCAVTKALGLPLYQVLTLVRTWRADDLGPELAPNLTPEMMRRVVKGSRCGAVKPLRDEWIARKCRPDGLRAAPRLLVTYADPAAGHDGATYLAAGAQFIEQGRNGKLLFCWPLDDETKQQLAGWLRARGERS